MFQSVLIRVDRFLGVDCLSSTQGHHHVLFRCESAILSDILEVFFLKFIQIQNEKV